MTGVTYCFLFVMFLLTDATNLARADDGFQADPSEQKQALEEGRGHLAKGEFPEAVASFKRLKQIDPSHPQGYFFLGAALAESGHLNAAAAEFSEALRLGPEQPEHALALANVLTRLGQKHQAMAVLETLGQKVTLDRITPANLGELMKLYFGLERTVEAMRVVTELASRNPGNPRLDFYRGKIYKMMGELDLAQQSIEKSLERNPGSPADLFELGRIYEQRGQAQAAKKAFLQALERQPDNPETLYAIGSICLARKEVDEAIRHLERCEAVAPGYPKIYYTLAQAYQRKGDSGKAAEYFERMKEHDAGVAERQKEIKDREESMLAASARDALKQGSASEARALFQQLAELNPASLEAHERLAVMCLASGDMDEAYLHLTKLQQIDPTAADGNRLMADYWCRRQDFSQALGFAQRAATTRPADAELHDFLGGIYIKLNQYEKALEEYGLAVKYDPDKESFRKDLENTRKLVKKR